MSDSTCPCGSGAAYAACCGPFHAGEDAPTAERLMRSRYAAYVRVDIDYLMGTTWPERRAWYNPDDLRAWAEGSEWLRLEVVRVKQGGTADETGMVEFKAHFIEAGAHKVHHEISRFKKLDGRWYFLDGKVTADKPAAPVRAKRNDPCPCGSGKKYKKCCG